MANAVAFLGGNLVALHAAWWSRPTVALAVLAVAGLLSRLPRLRWALAAGLGLALTACIVHCHLETRWPAELRDARALALVTIESIPALTAYGTVFDAQLRVLRGSDPGARLYVRVVWRAPPRPPRAADRWQLLVRLREPRAFVNPGTPDLERQYFRSGLHATAVVLDSRLNRPLAPRRFDLDRLRQRLAAGIRARVLERDAAALLTALAVGHTAEMSREQWRVFNATGTAHLVAISGLHVTFFALIAFALARRLWGPLALAGLRLPRESCAAAAGIAAAACYALLAGFSVPTQRTLLMLAVWAIAHNSSRPVGAARVYGVALVGVLIHDPRAPLAAGFWLSFAAVGVILLVVSAPVRAAGRMSGAMRVQLAVFAALLPVTLAFFGQLSLAGLIVNLVAIPLFGLVLVPFTLIGTAALLVAPDAAGWPLYAAERLHGLCWPWLAAAADWPHATVTAVAPLWWYTLALPAAAVLLLPLPAGIRVTGLIACLPLVFPPYVSPVPGAIELSVLDVGRGTAIIVRTARHVLLFGSGEVHGSAGERSERVLLPWLRAARVQRLDAIVLEKADADRAAGVGVLVAALPVTVVLTGTRWHGALVPVAACSATRHWRWDEVDFEILAVPGSTTCTLRIAAPGARVLLAGDLDAAAARRLAAAHDLAAEAVIAGRSGVLFALQGRTASAPQWLLVSAPPESEGSARTRAALAYWHARGARVYVTGTRGALDLRIDPRLGVLRVAGAREASGPPWRAGFVPRGP